MARAAGPPPPPPLPLLRLLLAAVAAANAALCIAQSWAVLGPPPPPLPPLYLQYTGFAGLNNQLGAHMRMLAIATGFNITRNPGDGPVTLVTSLAYSRRNFSSLWFDEYPIDHILDMEAYSDYWRPKGINVTKAADTAACLQLPMVDRDPGVLIFGRETDRHPGMTAADLVHRVTVLNTTYAIRAAVQKAVRAQTGLLSRLAGSPGPVECVAIELGWPAFLAMDWGVYWNGPQLAKSLAFPKRVAAAADAVLAALPPPQSGAAAGFRGVHLRVEEDFRLMDLYRADKNYDPVVRYIDTMKKANFTAATTVYFASGVFQTMNATEHAALARRFLEGGVMGGALNHKESLVPPATFDGLSTEQLALVDLLVLRRAAAVVGDMRSTFAENLKYMRQGDGTAPGSFVPLV
ncbi:hypothetical protein Rsub_11330 [Raphidocelis subcapitata]|uniref:Uncharacterized protein n=1 Tax=Raphidocelis subcapitata TaxID=307507 RepID=A0A2V0PD76_9CHLO|nr:hypothetical protein Rsub_11330 [Raphidocelis subcapitata]|eukprot:GBF97804.1 hypothetical protein Rsub_11330 [Raphidocelis subcapitata]